MQRGREARILRVGTLNSIKFQTRDGKTLAIIPALHIDTAGRRSTSLQVTTDSETWWLEYPGKEFRALENRFEIQIGKNVFSDQGAWLNADREGFSLHSTLWYGALLPLTSDIMGPFRFSLGCSAPTA